MGAGHLMLTHLVPGIDPEEQRAEAEAAYGRPVALAAIGATVAV